MVRAPWLYEDMGRSALVVEQAKAFGVIGAHFDFARDGQHNDLESAGGITLAKAWDPWIGDGIGEM